MPSRHLDPEQSRRYAEHRYDFNRKSLAGRVVLVPGGAGGLGAAIAAPRPPAPPGTRTTRPARDLRLKS